MFKKKVAVLALGVAAMASAQAVTVTIDNFSDDQVAINDLTANGTAVSSTLTMTNGIDRTVTSNMLTVTGSVQNEVGVGSGEFDVTNGTGDDSQVTISYALPAGLLPANATNPTFKLLVVGSDGNLTNVLVKLNGATLLNQNILPNTTNQLVGFTATAAAFDLGGTLELILNGAPGWDLTLDQFSFTYGEYSVPEPTSLALVALGLVGAGVARRKARKA